MMRRVEDETSPAIRVLAAGVLVLAAAIVFRGAFGAWYTGDDFSLLALTRLLDNPLWLFWQNHMLSMPYFRPLGVALWWLTERAFGHAAGWHYLVSLLLHAGVAITLWRFVVDLTRREWLGFATGLVFAVHPLAIGTTLWLSDRFDLLATLCGLLALRAAWRFRHAPGRRWPLGALTWLLLALLSKEIAFALLPAMLLMWWWPASLIHGHRRAAASAWLLVPVFVMLLARWHALGALGGGNILAGKALMPVLLRGLGSWFASLPAYFVFPHWMHATDVTLFALAGVVAGIWLVLRWQRYRGREPIAGYEIPPAGDWLAPVLGLCLFLAPAFIQWPMIGAVPVRAVDPAHILSSVTDSRYYYLALAGFLVSAAGLLSFFRASRTRREWMLPVIALAMMLLAFGATSQRLVRKWRFDTTPLRTLVESANQAIARLPLPQPACQIYLLGTRDLILGQYADDIVKATYPDIAKVANCLVQTEHTPWHHVIPRDAGVQQHLAPMTPLHVQGRRVPWPQVGNVDIAYLNLPEADAPRNMTNAWFLAWRNGRFVDVSADVREGRNVVRFHCNRPGNQCR